ncbi:MAG TPA: hypothetical protein VGE10_10155 [Zeimonas sp.]
MDVIGHEREGDDVEIARHPMPQFGARLTMAEGARAGRGARDEMQQVSVSHGASMNGA